MDGKKVVASRKLPAPAGVWSPAILIPSGKSLLFISGTTSRGPDGSVVGPGDIRVQTQQTLNNLEVILSEAGATFDDVVKVTVFVTDMNDFQAIHEVRRKYFGSEPPASTMVEVSRLADKRLKIEIEAIVALDT